MPIPRRVVQIWYQGLDAADGDVRARVEAVREHCRRAGFEYSLEDDASIRRRLSPEQLATYLGYTRLHERVDFAKVCLILFGGGVYMDVDAEMRRPLDAPGSPLDFSSENLYTVLFEPLRHRELVLVEVGIGTVTPGAYLSLIHI